MTEFFLGLKEIVRKGYDILVYDDEGKVVGVFSNLNDALIKRDRVYSE